MGITIHYRGSINSKGLINSFIDEVSDICDSMSWDYNVLNEDWNVPTDLSVAYEDEGVNLEGHAGLKGVAFRPHDDCEPIRLTFDSKGQLNSVMNLAFNHEPDDGGFPWVFSKTQFAGAETHVSVVKLLKYIKKKYVANLEVMDEGNYWETEDSEEVQKRMKLINNAMNALEEGLRELQDVEGLSEETIIQRIEEVMDNIGQSEGIQIKIMRLDPEQMPDDDDLENQLLEELSVNEVEDFQSLDLTNAELSELLAFEEEEENAGWESDFLDGFEEDDSDLDNPPLN